MVADICPTSSCRSCGAAATIRRRSTPPTRRPSSTKGAPTVILAKTIKGYGLGEAGEGRNITHQQKKLNEEELRAVPHPLRHSRSPTSDVAQAPFYRPPDGQPGDASTCARGARRWAASCPARKARTVPLAAARRSRSSPSSSAAAAGREVSTTMALRPAPAPSCCATRRSGKHIVPIVPDEARTFGMEALFRQIGIYSSTGQLYEPVDSETLLYYQEAKDGQILEEGITEAGSMSSFIAAGTAYATHGVNMIPFFIFYSMFGFQRIGDLIWAPPTRADGLPARRHRRPHDAERRRPAAPGRPQPPAGHRPSRTCWPTIRPTPTRSR